MTADGEYRTDALLENVAMADVWGSSNMERLYTSDIIREIFTFAGRGVSSHSLVYTNLNLLQGLLIKGPVVLTELVGVDGNAAQRQSNSRAASVDVCAGQASKTLKYLAVFGFVYLGFIRAYPDLSC